MLGGAELARLPQVQQQAYRIAQAQSVQLPYLAVAAALLLLASCVYLFRLPPLTEATELADPHPHTFTEVLRHRHVRLGVLAPAVVERQEECRGFAGAGLGLPDHVAAFEGGRDQSRLNGGRRVVGGVGQNIQ